MIRAAVLFVAMSAVLGVALHAQPPAADEPLAGIWSNEMMFAPGLHGVLTVARKGSAWSATLSGSESRSELTGDRLRFAFPSNGGEFRGTLSTDGRAITGFWLQPGGETQDPRDPGGSGQPFASPLVLRRVRAGTWRGTVRPLENRFTLYLRIFRDAEGSLIGAFRNPDQNSNGGSMQFRVLREGDSVIFTARRDPSEPEIRLTATFTRSPERLQIRWPDLNRVVDLTRRTPAEAAGFFPRPPGRPKYVYRKPPITGDGWETARARDVGMDETALAKVIQRLIDADPSVRRPALIHSILVAHKGKLVLEEYFYGFDRDRPHDLRSAGKTFASVMLGAAMKRGAAIAPETPVYILLAGMGPFANPDPRKAQITLANLMTHTSGLACDDNDDASPGQEDKMQGQTQQPNWWKYTLDLPMVHDPGTRYAYCSAGMNLLGAALTTATGTWLPEYFERTVARPLQFGPHYWNLMPTGEGYLGGGAYIRPRDLLKVGQAYLDGGAWHGRPLVDPAWVKLSTAPHMEVTPATTGLDSKQFSNVYIEAVDGFAWHLSELKSGDHTYRDYAATGNGGQLLIVVPELDLAVVFTAGNYGQGGIWGRFRDQIVPREIIPAIRH
ncbi:MAG TPA: serine hydrolase [Thermoanaerobaculia bacterium]|nr:serine hydrolase [Thermoanaerobaculia bacterium]